MRGIVFRDSETGSTAAKSELSQDPPISNNASDARVKIRIDAQITCLEITMLSMVCHGLNRVIDFALATAIVTKLADINWIPTVKDTSANNEV